ncbi:hypothetical protein E4U57_007028 [Claviceps arundinis]|uniref:Uncharacterized protein n=1 Tax=Claviceps arundinis TaxID=1623583 RepID=A0A9P7MTR8_9HYPO|nr:hypothetical protein E4U57_007028 [Claviceps arundinis]KAG5969987.1 hypothetical protein E4U56_008030 [Claviceps arundinis]
MSLQLSYGQHLAGTDKALTGTGIAFTPTKKAIYLPARYSSSHLVGIGQRHSAGLTRKKRQPASGASATVAQS